MRNTHFPIAERLAPVSARFALMAYFFLACLLLPSHAEGAALSMPQDAASLQHNRDLKALLSWLDRQRGTVIAMQRDLVALPALNPEHGGTGEEAKLRWVEGRLREYGITDFTRLDYTDPRVPGKIRGNLIAKFPSRRDDAAPRRTLWLLTHLDVFPPGAAEEWKGDPFTLRVEGDLLYGRGVEDNHQGIVTSLLLAEALRATGITPPLDIGLVFCSGALVNYDMNMGHVLDRRPDLFSPNDPILLLDYGSEDGAFIEVAEKQNIWFKFTATGKEGHAGSPHEAVNAFAVGAAFIHALRGLDDVFPEQNPLFAPPASTFSPTFAENHSTALNHIPGKFVFYVDARLIPEHSPEAVTTALRDLAETVGREREARIEFEAVELTARASALPSDAPVTRLLGRAIRAQLGVEPELGGIGGVTMASVVRERGFPVAVWGILKNWRNKTEEYASIASHIDQAKVLARLLLDPEAAGAENGAGDER